MAYSEEHFKIGDRDILKRSWLHDTDYAQGFQLYYITRNYWAWTTKKVLASEVYVMPRASDVKYYLKNTLTNVLTHSVKIQSQAGCRLFLPHQDILLQAEILKDLAELGVKPRVVNQSKLTDPTVNVDNWWNEAEYQRKKKKAEIELSRFGHPATIEFKVGSQKFRVVGDGKITKVVKIIERSLSVPKEKNG